MPGNWAGGSWNPAAGLGREHTFPRQGLSGKIQSAALDKKPATLRSMFTDRFYPRVSVMRTDGGLASHSSKLPTD